MRKISTNSSHISFLRKDWRMCSTKTKEKTKKEEDMRYRELRETKISSRLIVMDPRVTSVHPRGQKQPIQPEAEWKALEDFFRKTK